MDHSSPDKDSPFAYGKKIISEMPSSSTPFWGQDPYILLQKNRLSYFFPSMKLSLAENLNAISRLLLYLSILLILYTRNSNYILLPIVGFLVTYIIFYLYPRKSELFKTPSCKPCSGNERLLHDRENEEQRKIKRECINPTVDNPFMNFNYITDSYYRKPACKAFLYDDQQSLETREKVTDSFNYDLYRDVSDLYSKNNSQRQFFTMPWTSWPNDQTSFAKWLYKTGPTCKELGVKCAPYWNPSASYSVLDK